MSQIGKVLLDTNAVIAMFAKDAGIVRYVADADQYVAPCIVVGELIWGALKSTKIDENLSLIEELLVDCDVLPCDGTTAKQYGTIKNSLRVKGRPIPDNDIWIAATAIQYELPLLTNDKHFHEVDGLTMVNW